MKNKPLISAFDGLGMGLGFTIALILIGGARELLGAGTVFGIQVMPASYEPAAIFILAPGAFFVPVSYTHLASGQRRDIFSGMLRAGTGGSGKPVRERWYSGTFGGGSGTGW